MNRRGTSLIELLAIITLVLPVAGLAMGLAARLGQHQPSGAGWLADAVCLQLRRDAVGGAVIADDGLVLGGRRWHVADGWLCRDDVRRLRVDAASWTLDGNTVQLSLKPQALPPRLLELEVRP